MKEKQLYISKYKMLFELDDNGEYYPLLYDCEVVEGKLKGKFIEPYSIIGYWIMYVKWSFKEENKLTDEVKQGNLRLFQWKLSIDMLLDIVELNNSKRAIMATRQSGKSRLIRAVAGFTVAFANLWTSVPVHTTILLSYSEISVKKLFQELRLEIYKAVDFFNLMFEDRKLLRDREAKTINLVDNTERIAIGMLKPDGREVMYSEVYAFSGTVTRDGYSAHAIFCDEAQELNYDFVQKSIFPFTANSNGVINVTGVCTADSQSLMYKFYFNDDIERFIHSWKDHVEILSYTDVKKSEEYKQYALNYIKENGEHSTNTASNFTMRMDNLIEGKLLNMELLKNNNLLVGELEELIPITKDYYISIGLDIGMGGSGDRTIATVTKNKLIDDKYWSHEVVKIDAFTYHKDENLDQSMLYKKVEQLCINTHADFIMCDGTGLSKLIISGLNEYLRHKNIPTMVISYDFSGIKKSTMYQYGENCIYSRRVIFPREDLQSKDRGWALLLKELLMLLKYKKGSNNYYTYEAPNGEHDDCPASLMLSLFSCSWILQCELERKEITLGKYQFIPRLRKAKWNEEEKTEVINSWYF